MSPEISDGTIFRYNGKNCLISLILFCILIGFFTSVTAQECVDVPNQIENWWTGDGDTYDRIGDQYASMINGVAFDSGKVGQAFRFQEIRGCIDCGDLNTTEQSNGTYEMWFMTDIANSDRDPLNSFQVLLSKMYQGSLRARELVLENDQTIKFEIYDQSYPSSFVRIYTKPTEFRPDEWHHVAASWGDSGMKIYLDGVVNDSSNYTEFGYPSDSSFLIGNLKENFNAGREYGFYGELDEVSVYSRALTAKEIKAIYDSGRAGKCKLELHNPIKSPRINILED
ncbi:MAG: LamG domain-containing protein [Calditrichaceae bacterium]